MSFDAIFAALCLCVLGTLASFLLPGRSGRATGFACLLLVGVAAIFSACRVLATGVIAYGGWPNAHAALRVDAPSAFFLVVIGTTCFLVGVFGLGTRTADERRTGRTASATACAIALASLLACSAADVLLFIFAWELLALAFFWAIAYAGNEPEAPASAYFTLVVTHVAGACMMGALLFVAHAAGSYDVAAAMAAAARLSPAATGTVTVLLLVGFGAKFGMFPLHAWLPRGYRDAPSLVAALMAGGALNAGFYGVVRFVVGMPHVPVWFAVLALALGSLSAFFGIMWAAGQGDMRRLAAYSSVENGGIILCALAVAIGARALHLPMLLGFALVAAYVQIAAHAFAKCTLFLAISTIADRAATASLDALGGLARSMPFVTVVALLCAMSLCALPPMAGFVGEWLVLETLMQAFRTGNVALEVAFALGGALVGIAAGIAIVTFTKFVGIGMLGAPRSRRAAEATQTRSFWHVAGLALGALAIVLCGVFSESWLQFGARAVDAIAGAPATHAAAGTFPLVQPSFAGFASISPLGLPCVIAGMTAFFWLVTRCFARPPGRRAPVWTSGERYRAWTQYSATGYVNPTRAILDAGMRTVREIRVGERGAIAYRSFVRPLVDAPVYRAVASAFLAVADRVRSTQSGVIAAYLSYILAFVIVLLILYPSLRHW